MCLGVLLRRQRLSIGLGWLRLDEAQGRTLFGSARRGGAVQGVGWLSGYGGLCGVDGVVNGLGSRVWMVCRIVGLLGLSKLFFQVWLLALGTLLRLRLRLRHRLRRMGGLPLLQGLWYLLWLLGLRHLMWLLLGRSWLGGARLRNLGWMDRRLDARAERCSGLRWRPFLPASVRKAHAAWDDALTYKWNGRLQPLRRLELLGHIWVRHFGGVEWPTWERENMREFGIRRRSVRGQRAVGKLSGALRHTIGRRQMKSGAGATEGKTKRDSRNRKNPLHDFLPSTSTSLSNCSKHIDIFGRQIFPFLFCFR
jgi:hypothetical protein